MDKNLNNIDNDLLKIGQCESQEEFIEIMDNIKTTNERWREEVMPKLIEKRISAAMIVEGCNISHSTAKRIKYKIPAKRDVVIGIGILLEYNVDEINALLSIAQYEKLYSRNINDAIWIYLIESNCAAPEKNRCKTPAKAKNDLDNFAESIRKLIKHTDEKSEMGTVTWLYKIKSTKELVEFEKLIRDHAGELAAQNQRLISAIIDAIKTSDATSATNLFEDNRALKDFHDRQLSTLRTGGHPNRIYLIILGLKLNFSADKINNLLNIAGFSPLCPNDRLEAAIFYILETANINSPYFFPENYSNFEFRDYFDTDITGLSEEMLSYFKEHRDCYSLVVERLAELQTILSIDLSKIHSK